MKQFDYLAPTSVDEAVTMLAERPEAAVLAGGTNLLVQLKEQHRQESALLSLRHVPELHALSYSGDLNIGAAVTMQRLAADPIIRQDFHALSVAAGLIGSVQTRNMATIGGNICNASPSADTAPSLLALQAQVVLVSASGVRTMPLAQFFVSSGKTALGPGELLREIILPAPPECAGSAYVRHIPRQAMDISVVGVAAALALDEEGQIADAHVALGAVAPTPLLATATAGYLVGRRPGEAVWEHAGDLAAEEAQPVDDVRGSIAYRRHLVRELTKDALHAALSNLAEREEA